MVQDAGKPLICVLDGLDQCDDNYIDSLVRPFEELVAKSFSRTPQLDSAQFCLKVVLTNRPFSKKTVTTLKRFPHIILGMHSPQVQSHIESDIRIFVDSKFGRYFPVDETANYFPNDTKRDEWYCKTKAMLVEKANGTFLWASSAMEQLENIDPHEVEDELNKLPEGLEAFYARILLQVQDTYRGAGQGRKELPNYFDWSWSQSDPYISSKLQLQFLLRQV
jgi:hypothetical protein